MEEPPLAKEIVATYLRRRFSATNAELNAAQAALERYLRSLISVIERTNGSEHGKADSRVSIEIGRV